MLPMYVFWHSNIHHKRMNVELLLRVVTFLGQSDSRRSSSFIFRANESFIDKLSSSFIRSKTHLLIILPEWNLFSGVFWLISSSTLIETMYEAKRILFLEMEASYSLLRSFIYSFASFRLIEFDSEAFEMSTNVRLLPSPGRSNHFLRSNLNIFQINCSLYILTGAYSSVVNLYFCRNSSLNNNISRLSYSEQKLC